MFLLYLKLMQAWRICQIGARD